MLQWLKNKLLLFSKIPDPSTAPQVPKPTRSLNKKLNYFKQQFIQSPDFIIRELSIFDDNKTRAVLVYIDGLVDKGALEIRVIKRIMNAKVFASFQSSPQNLITTIYQYLLPTAELYLENELHKIVEAVLQGEAALMVDGFEDALILSYQQFASRGIVEPESEKSIQGPKIGFTEEIRTNTSLLRRYVNSPDLVLEMTSIGVVTKTPIAIAYIKGIARLEIVREVKRRLHSFKIDGIFSSGTIEELIKDSPFSPFRTTSVSERPDRVASKILEGRVALIVDGTPFVITIPHVFIENFHTAGDYYGLPIFQSALRILRILAFFFSVFTVPIYVGLVSFHQELLPDLLAFTFAAERVNAPFPAFIEAILLSFFFELLREAGIRMPSSIGGAINIVGALVIGDAAVKAGLVGTPMIIVIALTAIASFTVPSLFEATTILRYIFLVLVGFLGFYGLTYGFIITLIYMNSLYSFGVPYMAPLSPFIAKQMPDAVIRAPIWLDRFRPKQFAQDRKRGEFRLEHLNKDKQGENH